MQAWQVFCCVVCMRTNKLFAWMAVAAFCCLSCNGSRKQSDDIPGTKPDTVTVQGIFTYGDGYRAFRECGDDSTIYRVADPDTLLAGRAAEYRFFSGDRTSVYAELDAIKAPLSSEETDENGTYDRLLKVVRVLNVTAKNFKTECFPYDFWCVGNEPFWSIEISGGEHLIRLTDLGTESAHTYSYVDPVMEGDQYRYEVPAEGAAPPLLIVVTKEPCSDGMSDRQYDYRVNAKAGERELAGCAIGGTNLSDL